MAQPSTITLGLIQTHAEPDPAVNLARTSALIEEYCVATRCNLPARFDLYVAAGLLRLAPHAFRDREPDWPERTQAILERVEEMVQDG